MTDIYTTANGWQFRIIEEYSVQGDAWIEYENMATGQRYTARKAAFLVRFRRQVTS